MMYSREVARRVFLEELRRSDLSFREGDDSQYAPQYLLTPTGARCNRVFVVGTLIDRDDIGEEVEYWRGRLADPTGSILIYAGQYQPEASRVLAEIEIPAFVAVVGKPSVYETEDGKKITSIRAEAIQKVDLDTRNKWIMEAARRTLERLELMRSIDVPHNTDFQPGTMYHPEATTLEDCKKAMGHYSTKIEEYRQMVLTALNAIRKEQEIEEVTPAMAPVETEVPADAGKPLGEEEMLDSQLAPTAPRGSDSRLSQEVSTESKLVEARRDVSRGSMHHPARGKTPVEYEKDTETELHRPYTRPQPSRRKQTGSKRISSLIDLDDDDVEEIDI
ncbi:nucleic acid binding, OB-fold, tRNA/helicase-type [Methanothrix thermoacetophila PT]|uniref:Nucleic acid binding, OB-fold, tRNA/helicase-type n=2 Tax=Methanothrix TaxID=2222 RepID=A0B944_METTP|nr:nucleic acid binding, OB-fold, tRNA/helicase-type [Methanothrix thermoacetophila PT]